jgi:iron complex outermembrane recepter protein
VIPRLPPMNYLDLAASWTVGKQLTFRVGVNNATDRDPPLITNGGGRVENGNTFAQTYDALGRHIFVILAAKF